MSHSSNLRLFTNLHKWAHTCLWFICSYAAHSFLAHDYPKLNCFETRQTIDKKGCFCLLELPSCLVLLSLFFFFLQCYLFISLLCSMCYPESMRDPLTSLRLSASTHPRLTRWRMQRHQGGFSPSASAPVNRSRLCLLVNCNDPGTGEMLSAFKAASGNTSVAVVCLFLKRIT